MALVDVVVVSYNSREWLRQCIEPLAGLEDVNVIVVDNASTDGSLDVVADLPLRRIPLTFNGGFGRGCNVGWQAGESIYVLFLNPDARLERAALRRLVRVLEDHPAAGAVGPRIVGPQGSLSYSLRRFPRLRSTYAQALFLHRLFPLSTWSDEVVRDETVYARPGTAEWVSGSCILVGRSALELLGGFDQDFFLYREDVDLCRRLRDNGYDVRFEPDAVCVHEGGASAPRAELLPVLAASRLRYARKHRRRVPAAVERMGIGLGAFTHFIVSRGGWRARLGHARSLRPVLFRK